VFQLLCSTCLVLIIGKPPDGVSRRWSPGCGLLVPVVSIKTYCGRRDSFYIHAFGHSCLTVHTHTRLTALCMRLPGWAGTRKVKLIWILQNQETVSGSGVSWAICKSAPRFRQITTSAPHHSVFYRPDALPVTQPTASKHWRQLFMPIQTAGYLTEAHCQFHARCSLKCFHLFLLDCTSSYLFFLHRKHQSSSSKKKSSHKHSKSKRRHREKKTSSDEDESEDSSSESEASGDSRQLSDKAVKESKSKQHHKHRHKHGDESHRRRHKKSHRKSRKHSSEQHAWNWQRASVTQPAVWMCIKCVWPLSDSCNVKSKDLTDCTDCLLTWCGEPF